MDGWQLTLELELKGYDSHKGQLVSLPGQEQYVDMTSPFGKSKKRDRFLGPFPCSAIDTPFSVVYN